MAKYVVDRDFESFEHLFQCAQGDALLTHFKPVKGGGREAGLAGESRVSLLSPLLFEKGGKLPIEFIPHAEHFACVVIPDVE
ncbi:MAG: hypothetical protein AAGK14_08730 [Verrucomicrobiota bacterium]